MASSNNIVSPIVPSNWNLSGFNYSLTTGSPAVSGAGYRNLLIAQAITNTGTVPVFATSVNDIANTYGHGSSIALAYAGLRQLDQTTETYVLPLPDPSGSAAEVVVLVGPALLNAYGQIPALVAGVAVPVITKPGYTAGSIYVAIAAAVNNITDIPVTAATDGSTGVTLTAKNVGVVGNFDVRFAYYGARAGEVIPTGVTLTTTTIAGVGAPDLGTIFATLPEMPFSQVLSPYSDIENVNQLDAFMNSIDGAWSNAKQLFGEGVVALNVSSAADALTWVSNFDTKFVSAFPIQNSPEPIYQVLAKAYGYAGLSTSIDPGTPIQNEQLGLLAPALQDRWSSTTRNSLKNAGLSTFRTDNTGTVWAEDFVTMYTTDATGQTDYTYSPLERMNVISDIIQYLKAYMLAAYPHVKILRDGISVPTGADFTTPQTARATLNSGYNQLCKQFRADNLAFFVANSAVQFNAATGELRFFAPITPTGMGKQINIGFSVYL